MCRLHARNPLDAGSHERPCPRGYRATALRAMSVDRWLRSAVPARPVRDFMIDRIVDGRTDLVFDFVAAGHPATWTDKGGTPLIRHCHYYGDVSAIKFLLSNGASLDSLGDNLDLNGACFYGHWRLCEYLVEMGADVNKP